MCVIDTIHFDVIVTVIKHLIIYKTECVLIKIISTLLYYYWCSIVLDKTDVKGKLLIIFRA